MCEDLIDRASYCINCTHNTEAHPWVAVPETSVCPSLPVMGQPSGVNSSDTISEHRVHGSTSPVITSSCARGSPSVREIPQVKRTSTTALLRTRPAAGAQACSFVRWGALALLSHPCPLLLTSITGGQRMLNSRWENLAPPFPAEITGFL